MRGGGVLAFAVPSAVAADPAITMAQLLDSMAFSSKFRAGGVASTERRAGRVVAASYISARVPNTFCAQPLWDHEACGSYDSLLLVNASRLAVAACGAALHDAGCRNLCTAAIPDAETCHECTAYKGRATHKDPHKDVLSCAFRGNSWRRDLERAMQRVRSTCDANGGSWRPWKPPWDTLMSSEVQLRAETIRGGLIEDALLAVGTIVVDDPVATLAWQRQKLDAARHTRPCRSRLVATRLAARLGRPIEEWRFTIDASRGLRVAQPPRSYPMVPLRGNQHHRQSLQFPVATDYGGLWVPPATAWGYFTKAAPMDAWSEVAWRGATRPPPPTGERAGVGPPSAAPAFDCACGAPPTIVDHLNFQGFDLSTTSRRNRRAPTPEACRAACDGDARCVAFTFITEKVDFPQHCFLKAAGFEARAQFSSGTVSGVKAGCSAGCGGALRGVIDASPPPPPPTSLVDAVLRWAGFRREW